MRAGGDAPALAATLPLQGRVKCIRSRLRPALSRLNFKQPSLFVLAAGFPRELRILFSISLPQGERTIYSLKEGAERRMAHPGCLLSSKQATSLAIGRPRLTALHRGVYGRWDPSAPPERQAVLPALTSPDGATERFHPGPIMGQEAFSTRPPGARSRNRGRRVTAPHPRSVRLGTSLCGWGWF